MECNPILGLPPVLNSLISIYAVGWIQSGTVRIVTSVLAKNTAQWLQPGHKPRGFIRSRQLVKIAAYFVRIYLSPPPTLSVFSLKLIKKFISLPPTLVKSDSYFKTYWKPCKPGPIILIFVCPCFVRLQERFVTPLSTGGPCPSPSFSNVQEFFKGFIQSAARYVQHLVHQSKHLQTSLTRCALTCTS